MTRHRKKLEPKSWHVYQQPKKRDPHNRLVGIPCTDCKTPIWAGDRLFVIRGFGSVRDVRDRHLFRERDFLICEDCCNLRWQYHNVKKFWPGIKPTAETPWSEDVVQWASKGVEDALDRMGLVDRES